MDRLSYSVPQEQKTRDFLRDLAGSPDVATNPAPLRGELGLRGNSRSRPAEIKSEPSLLLQYCAGIVALTFFALGHYVAALLWHAAK